MEKGKEESYYTLQWEISPRVKFHLVRINAVVYFNWQVSLDHIQACRVFSRDVVLGGGELLLWGEKM